MNIVIWFIYLFLAAGSSLLRGLFCSCSKQGLLFLVVHGLLTVVTSLAVELKAGGLQ